MATNNIEPSWTSRQREVLDLLAREKTNAEIADVLGVSLAGAKWHVSEVLSILGCASREEAASYWRAERSLAHRFRRGARAFGGSIVSLKAAAGATGFAAIFGGTIVLSNISFDADSPTRERLVADSSPIPGIVPADDWVVIGSLTLTDGRQIDLLGAKTSTGGICVYPDDANSPLSVRSGNSGFGCGAGSFTPSLSPSFGYSRPALFNGSTGPEADHIEVELYDGSLLTVPLWPAPSALGGDFKFYLFAAGREDLVGTLRAVGPHGEILDEYTLFDSPGTPPRVQISAPLSELVLVGSNRSDQASGLNTFAGSRPGAVAQPDGGTYHFSVEHTGSVPLILHFWCQTGVLPLTWESGPDSAGNGILSAQVPPNSAGCFFLVNGGDGDYRIMAYYRAMRPAPS